MSSGATGQAPDHSGPAYSVTPVRSTPTGSDRAGGYLVDAACTRWNRPNDGADPGQRDRHRACAAPLLARPEVGPAFAEVGPAFAEVKPLVRAGA
ncbi:hypothetical protein ACQEVC_41760 [Plantactinospora sp. CA-294935]|uniref:hypothetical protein n=1 Tax=Plantactinospora sp. CA-294935 TaxID=3240012 RepID=UPI003D8E7DFF